MALDERFLIKLVKFGDTRSADILFRIKLGTKLNMAGNLRPLHACSSKILEPVRGVVIPQQSASAIRDERQRFGCRESGRDGSWNVERSRGAGQRATIKHLQWPLAETQEVL